MSKSQTPAPGADIPPRLPHESQAAYVALCLYLELGAERSLEALLTLLPASGATLPSLRRWSRRFAWPERAGHFDQLRAARAELEALERRKEILQSGLALSSERVDQLKRLYAETENYLHLAWPVWIDSLQNPGSQPVSANQRLNTNLIGQMRAILDDLARETGGRGSHPQTPVSVPAEPAGADLGQLSLGELEELEKLLQKAGPGLSQPALPGLDTC